MNNTKKEEKAESKAIKKYSKDNVKTPDLLPFACYEGDCFKLRNGKYIDLLKIICKDISSMSEEEAAEINYTFEKFYRTYSPDIKIIGINMPVDTTHNQKFINHKIQNCKNPTQRELLETELAEQEYVQKILTQKSFFIMFFFESLEQRNESVARCLKTLGEHVLVDNLSRQEKETVIFKLCNKNTPIDVETQLYQNRLPKEEAIIRYVDDIGYDPYLISRIQPQGGIHFKDDRFITTGTGFEACIHIYDYKVSIDNYWLNPLLNINNVVAVMDVSTENTDVANKNLNKSMDEQESRYYSAMDNQQKHDARNRYNELEALLNEINNFEEIIKLIHIRLYVSGQSKAELDKNVSDVITVLRNKGYRGAIFLGENEAEWRSMFQSYGEQSKNQYARYGQVVPAHNLAFGNPFIFSSLNDKYGLYLGTTRNSAGIFNFDPWAITPYRTHYNGLVAGVMGMGKSTTLKQLITTTYSLGTYIRGFDVKDEYGTLVDALGGKMIYLDGTGGIINLLDILATENTEYGSYTKHISKLRTIYQFFKRSASDNELSTFTDMLNKLYETWNLRGDNGEQITGLPAEQYPTMSDLLNVINGEINKLDTVADTIQQQIEIERRKQMLNVQTTIKEIVNSFGKIFDGHTTITNIFSEQVVFFNISKLKDYDKSVFAAQVFNAISMCWENCIRVQTPMKEGLNNNSIAWEDIHRYMIVIDEAHRIINAENDFALTPITNYVREARHLFAGLWFATQNTSDFVPEGSSAVGVQKLQTLFELCQYKFIMKQDSNTLPLLTKIFKQQMTDSEVSIIPRLGKGQGILSISGDTNIVVNIDISDDRLNLFNGGA